MTKNKKYSVSSKGCPQKSNSLFKKHKFLTAIFIFIALLVFTVNVRNRIMALNYYNMATVATHSISSNCWVVISDGGIDKVFNLSSPNNDHDGKTNHMRDQIASHCGGNMTTAFNSHNHSAAVWTALRNTYFVGNLDDVAPAISITFPPNNRSFDDPSITVGGTASDNISLSKVEVKLNSGAFQIATGTTNWMKTLVLASGTNTITAQATDAAGNIKTTSINVTYVAPIPTSTPISTPTTAPTVSPSSSPIVPPTSSPPPPGSGGWVAPIPPSGVTRDINAAVLSITNWILGFIGFISVLAIIWGGFLYLTSAGNDRQMETAKNTIKWAILGLAIAGLAYAIVYAITNILK